MPQPLFITPDWSVSPRVRALCTLRHGGRSEGGFRSFNFGQRVGDAPEALAANLSLLTAAAQLPSEPPWLQQVHGCRVVDLDQPGDREADAAITRAAGRVCAIQTADCLPVLLAVADGTGVAAAHAGWRGLASGVLESAVKALSQASSSSEIVAWLGPAIGPAHFEVGEDVRTAFLDRDPGAGIAFAANARGRWQCDLYLLARLALARVGVKQVRGGGYCTHADGERFYSYRRDGGQTGRMASLIWLEPTP